MASLVELVRRFCVEFASGHNTALLADLAAPEFTLHISGRQLAGRDEEYRASVESAYERFPALGLTVHDVLTDGERIAVRFTEHGASSRPGHRAAAWSGLALFAWDGTRLVSDWTELDLFSRARQLRTGTMDPIEAPHPDPWTGLTPDPAPPEAFAAVRKWLLGGGPPEAEVVLDDGWTNPTPAARLEISDVEVDTMVGNGDRVAFHAVRHGRYAGGLADLDDHVGADAFLPLAGIATVRDGTVVAVRAVTDRYGLRQRLQTPKGEGMILITGTMDIDGRNRDEFVEAVSRLMKATREEPGCQCYAVTADVDDPARFHVHEQWATAEALDEHRKMPHMADFQAALKRIGLQASELVRHGVTGSETILSFKR